MSITDDIAFIVNPAAGRGGGAQVWRKAESELLAANIPYSVSFTGAPGDATALTGSALRRGVRTVVSVGGDGTVHEVVNGFFDQGNLVHPAARVAFLTAGTGNDVGRMFQLRDVARLDESTTHVDVLRIRYSSAPSDLAERYALMHVGAGLVTEVVETSNRLKGKLGKLVYVGGSAVALSRHRPSTIRFSYDDGPAETQTVSLIMVANGKYTGGGMKIAPPASIQDGLLDVVTLRGAGRLEMLLRLLPAVYRGSHMGHSGVRHMQARTVLVESDVALSIELDGELAGTTPVWIDVLPQVLPVCLPLA